MTQSSIDKKNINLIRDKCILDVVEQLSVNRNISFVAGTDMDLKCIPCPAINKLVSAVVSRYMSLHTISRLECFLTISTGM